MADEIRCESIEGAEYLDPLRYAIQAANEPTAETAAVGNLIAKADAGARLFYALYHHPKARELFGSEFMSLGLSKAYMSASNAFLPGKEGRPDG